ncbi:MAG: hypothetical protein B6244_01665 [Candidatus Cloacimonetes bacterium 4572_55]|nr:MAG: hypothetical protein B6244_01665 [Candidatus Cloacimonetes bacterium 4572_55]
MNLIQALGLSMTAGLSAFLPIFLIGCISRFTDWITLPENYQFLQYEGVIAAAGILALLEFFADKIPAVDHFWDATQTFIRPIAGIILAVAAVGDVNPGFTLFAGILGGGMAGAVHTSKSTVRLMSTSSTAGILNPVLSLVEDVMAFVGTFLALFSPWITLIVIILFFLFFIWLLPKFGGFFIFRFKVLLSWIRWKLTKPMIKMKEGLYRYGVSLSKIGTIEKNLEHSETVQTVIGGQIWLQRQKKNVWLVCTSEKLWVFVRGLFGGKIWSYPLDNVVNCHVEQGMTVQYNVTVPDQMLSFEFLKTATPYIAHLDQLILDQEARTRLV